jgi:undecaprenyl-diphosphatase
MAAATGYDLMKNASSFSSDQFQFLAVGFIVSFISAVAAIRWLLAYVKNHTFLSFGVYRIILVILFLLIFI